MSDQPYRATIPPVSEDIQRPLWSVMIPTYNCATYLRHTLTSVLAQDPGPEVMQIEVIDDHSTQDDPEAVVHELGQGRVSFYRQPQNVGYIRNFETCLLRSRGHLVHLLHGDDCVRPGFYPTLQGAFERQPEIGAAYCRHLFMDDAGHWTRLSPLEQAQSGLLTNSLQRLFVRHPIQTPSIVVRRSVYEQLGSFDRRFSCNGEDWEMWVRIAANYPIWYEVEPLAIYRSRSTSLSGQAIRHARDLKDIQQGLALMTSYLPEAIVQSYLPQAKEFWALCGLHNAIRLLGNGDAEGAMNQIREGLRLCPSLKILAVYGFYLLPKLAMHLTRQPDPSSMFLNRSSHLSNKPS